MNTDFTLANVLKLKKRNEKKDDHIIDFHYKRVVQKIKRIYNEYHDNCYYEVNTFIPCLPLYNANDITTKLFQKMLKNKFQCRIVYQNQIYIYWKPKKRKKKYIPDILKLAKRSIERAAEDDKDECNFEVPIVMISYPWYDANEVAIIIERKLKSKGFIVNTYPNSHILHISWNIKDIERKTKTKINFKTMEETREDALNKINYINEQRYVDFINPKKATVDYPPPIEKEKKVASKIDLRPIISQPPSRNYNSYTMNNEFLRGLSNLRNDVRSIN